MILFCDSNGTIQKNLGSPVYQGSANSNIIYLIAPYAPNVSVLAAFQLPDGTALQPVEMTKQSSVPGVQNADGTTFAGWSYVLPGSVTAKYGTVSAQFYFYSPTGESENPTAILATASTSFQVARGVTAILPDTPDADVYESILSNIAQLQTDLTGGYYAARAIYAWNSAYTYGANEITFYPVGNYGAFVKSLVNSNTQQPYTSAGVLNFNWTEVANFNTIADDFYTEIQTAVQQAQTAQAGAEAAEEAAQLAQTLAQSAQNDAVLAREGAEAAQNAAEQSATDSQGFANTAANYASSAQGSATSAATSASNAQNYAEQAKQIADGIGSVYIPQGSIPFASLPAEPSENERGYVWDISDNFVTDDRFLGGAGLSYSAGSNVACVLNNGSYKYDVLSGFVDLSNYAQKTDLYIDLGTQQFNESFSINSDVISALQSGKNVSVVVSTPAAQLVFADFYGGNLDGEEGYFAPITFLNPSQPSQMQTILLCIYSTTAIIKGVGFEAQPAGNYALQNGTYSGMTVGKATQADNAATATDSEKLGGVLATNYAINTGTYPNMTVGNATNATTADSADSADSAQDSAKLGGVAAEQYAKINGTYSEMTVGKATSDANGNNIVNTYAKSSNISPFYEKMPANAWGSQGTAPTVLSDTSFGTPEYWSNGTVPSSSTPFYCFAKNNSSGEIWFCVALLSTLNQANVSSSVKIATESAKQNLHNIYADCPQGRFYLQVSSEKSYISLSDLVTWMRNWLGSTIMLPAGGAVLTQGKPLIVNGIGINSDGAMFRFHGTLIDGTQASEEYIEIPTAIFSGYDYWDTIISI